MSTQPEMNCESHESWLVKCNRDSLSVDTGYSLNMLTLSSDNLMPAASQTWLNILNLFMKN